jgi:hypothetical protein
MNGERAEEIHHGMAGRQAGWIARSAVILATLVRAGFLSQLFAERTAQQQ